MFGASVVTNIDFDFCIFDELRTATVIRVVSLKYVLFL